MNIDEYIETLEPPIDEVVTELRSIVKSSSKLLQEDIKWKVPTYSVNSNICSIVAHKRHVNLQVFQGAHIATSKHLSGTGKDMRHIKYVTVRAIDRALIKKIISQAIALDKKQ